MNDIIEKIKEAVGGFTPAFEGSSDYHFRYAPLIDVIYRDRVFLNTNRLRVNLLPSGNLRGPKAASATAKK